jgi:hypothetical protein
MLYRNDIMILQSLALLCLATAAPAQIASLCNTGQTSATSAGCSNTLEIPNAPGGGPDRDGNWQVAYPYPSALTSTHGPCALTGFVRAWVDTPNTRWLANSVSSASQWIAPFDGENNLPAGPYVYRTQVYIPALLPGGLVPSGLTINGQLASDNGTVGIYLESPAHSALCSKVIGQSYPVNPMNSSGYTQWWDFSFSNSLPISPGTDAFIYFVADNQVNSNGQSPTGLRVEFFSSSTLF